MDVPMKDASLDDMIKRDKKLGRARQANQRVPLRGGRPLPGKGRGGNQQNAAARPQQRLRKNPNGIQKQRNNNQT